MRKYISLLTNRILYFIMRTDLMLGPEEYFTTGVFFMKKFGKDKIALFLACTSLLSDKASAMNMGKTQNQQPVAAVGGAISRNNQSVKQGLSKKQKFTIATIASILAVTAVGLTIWGVKKHLSSKNNSSKKDNKDDNKKNNENIEVSNEDNAENLNENSPKKGEKINNNSTLNKKNNSKTQDQEFKFRDQNMKMIRENSGLDEEKIDTLIGIINRKDSILGYISSIYSDGGEGDDEVFYDKQEDGELTKEITDKYGLSDGNSWVEELFDNIRGKSKILKIENFDKMEFCVYFTDGKYLEEYYRLNINGNCLDIRRIDPDEDEGIEDITVSYVFE